eukprot:scaffold730_cov206-Alexandrium_tamarense.AAC.23
MVLLCSLYQRSVGGWGEVSLTTKTALPAGMKSLGESLTVHPIVYVVYLANYGAAKGCIAAQR